MDWTMDGLPTVRPNVPCLSVEHRPWMARCFLRLTMS